MPMDCIKTCIKPEWKVEESSDSQWAVQGSNLRPPACHAVSAIPHRDSETDKSDGGDDETGSKSDLIGAHRRSSVSHRNSSIASIDARPIFKTRTCVHCGTEFPFNRSVNAKHRGLYCSHKCAGYAPRTRDFYHVPDSDKTLRIRAAGLVNMRLKRGTAERPKNCQSCGVEKRLDSHHPDYSHPDLVLFLCRSCHMRSHHWPGFEAELLQRIELTTIPRSAVAQ